MEYRYYIWRKGEFEKSAFEAFMADVLKILKKTTATLAINQMSGDAVRFNGVKNNEGELFEFPRFFKLSGTYPFRDSKDPNRLFYSVNTGKKAYDEVVAAILILAKLHFDKDIRLLCDGQGAGLAVGLPLLKLALGEDLEGPTLVDTKNGIELSSYVFRKKTGANVKGSSVVPPKPPAPKIAVIADDQTMTDFYAEYEKKHAAELQKAEDKLGETLDLDGQVS